HDHGQNQSGGDCRQDDQPAPNPDPHNSILGRAARRYCRGNVTLEKWQVGCHCAVEDQLMRIKSYLKVALGAALSLVTTSAMAQAPAVELKVGDMAPAFSAPGSV